MSFMHEVEHQIRATIFVDPKSHLRANLPDRAATKDLGINWDFAWNLYNPICSGEDPEHRQVAMLLVKALLISEVFHR
jgi:hypothetical protein